MTGRARIKEIAALANVGTATVDRVLHGRSHVAHATKQKVLKAQSAIESGAWTVRGPRPWRLEVILPEMAGLSTEYLARCFEEFGERGNAVVECGFSKKLEPKALARKLRSCGSGKWDAVAFQALEDPRVREAVSYLKEREVPCLSLLSSLPNSDVVGFVGSDARSAGRTAGLLMGLSCAHSGTIAIVSGGQLYRSHENREMGFRSYIREHAKHLTVLDTLIGQDDSDQNYEQVATLIRECSDLIGIYNVGGGNEGLIQALQEADLANEVCIIAHNLTPRTREHLSEGILNFVLHQDMRILAERSMNAIIAYITKQKHEPSLVPVEIVTRENVGFRETAISHLFDPPKS